MSKWLRRFRGALGMGVTWAFAWALTGILIGLSSFFVPMGWFMEVFDAPLPALAVPGFFAGAAFSLVLGVAGRKRRFDELSVPRFAAWGAAGGLLLSALPLAAAEVRSIEVLTVAVGSITFLSAASASATLLLARMSEDRELLDASTDVAEVGLSEREARELLGNGG